MLESRLALAGIVPAFSSLPGADHTVYLDFDGHTTTGTYWNNSYGATITNQPYDTDSLPDTFSATELAAIEDAWKRISEDFIPFNVNVTTVDPGVEALRKSGTGDAQWGVRAVVTKDTAMACGCGGIAYIDSFNWNTDTPVFVYTTGGKNIAEAASHEVGHALGLSHDGTNANPSYYSGHGTGDTGWASIMGVGYYKNVTQWDRGEYFDSNNAGTSANYSKGPDDLAVITTYNGFGYRADAVGDSSVTATPLTVVGETSVSAAGLIERSTDTDVFSFSTGAGSISLSVSPFAPGPNLDVRLSLLDGAGNLVATADPAATLAGTLTATVPAGQYFLAIDGVGVGTPGVSPPTGYSDYASIGRYTIAGTIVGGQPVLPTLAITDVSVNESAGTALLTVSISGAFTSAVSVDFTTANGTAAAGSDYAASSGTLTFQPGGATTLQISVPIQNDTATESTESLAVNLSNAAGGLISDGQGVITITDDDVAAPPTISISDVTAQEGNLRRGKTTTKNFTFTLTLSQARSSKTTVRYATANGTATAGSDFASASGTLTFSAGQTTKTLSIKVTGDNLAEQNETFFVNLSNAVGATIGDGQGVGTIQNDDGAAALLAAMYDPDSELPPITDELIEELISPDMFPLPGAEDDHHGHSHEDDHDGDHRHHDDHWLAHELTSSRRSSRHDDDAIVSLLARSRSTAVRESRGDLTPTLIASSNSGSADTWMTSSQQLRRVADSLAGLTTGLECDDLG